MLSREVHIQTPTQADNFFPFSVEMHLYTGKHINKSMLKNTQKQEAN